MINFIVEVNLTNVINEICLLIIEFICVNLYDACCILFAKHMIN